MWRSAFARPSFKKQKFPVEVMNVHERMEAYLYLFNVTEQKKKFHSN
jgi:hypothetical protein